MSSDTIPRLVVQDTVSANAMPAWAPDWYASIETRVRWPLDEGVVLESIILCKVVDDKRREIGVSVEGQASEVRDQIDRVIANALLLGKDGTAPADTIVLELWLPSIQGQRPRGLGKDIAVPPVKERYQTSSRIQAEGSELCEGGQGLVL